MSEERGKGVRLLPLPWTAHDSGPCSMNHVVVRDANGTQVAMIPKSRIDAIGIAEMFCRAPALEQAARDAIPQMEMLWECGGDCVDENMSAVARDALNALRAALENANG